ncbi:MAG: arsenate reductase family protein [Bacteroidota bacterium]
MKRIYHLSSCTTNQRMLKELKPGKDIEMIDIKETNIDPETLDWLKEKIGSYEALFSKKALKYRSLGLDKMNLTEEDYRRYMLEEYTFLKRPFIIIEDRVLVGNTKRTLDDARGMLR